MGWRQVVRFWHVRLSKRARSACAHPRFGWRPPAPGAPLARGACSV